MNELLPVSTLLPEPARARLIRAAATPIDDDDPLARRKAIESATLAIKQQYPQFFHQPKGPSNDKPNRRKAKQTPADQRPLVVPEPVCTEG